MLNLLSVVRDEERLGGCKSRVGGHRPAPRVDHAPGYLPGPLDTSFRSSSRMASIEQAISAYSSARRPYASRAHVVTSERLPRAQLSSLSCHSPMAMISPAKSW